jgi:hypothetical protein
MTDEIGRGEQPQDPAALVGTGCTRVAADIGLPRGELAQPENHLSSRA